MTNVGAQGELELEGLTKRWRFPMLIFSDQGRCFFDEDIPKDFAQKGKQAIEQAHELLALEGIDKNLQRELIQFLSYCHKLMPKPAVDDLLQAATNKQLLRHEHLSFKYALGDVSQPWQQQLLRRVLNPVDDSGGTRAVTLEILSVAMWRDKAVIHQLTAEQVISLANRLNGHLLEEVERIDKQQGKPYQWKSFILRLELLLALLRTRESSDTTISSLFALDSNLTKQLLNTVEKITNKQGEALVHQPKQPRVVARVELAVNKPAAYRCTPDLLYALKLYLSGDDGADQITITELVNSA